MVMKTEEENQDGEEQYPEFYDKDVYNDSDLDEDSFEDSDTFEAEDL